MSHDTASSVPDPFSAPWTPFPPPPPKKRSQLYSHGHPNDRRRPLDYSSASTQPRTDRQKHLQYLHSLLHVLLQRHPTILTQKDREKNATHIGRILRVLWSCKEWREGELWHEGLAWAGLERGDGQPSRDDEGNSAARRRRSDSNDAVSVSSSAPASPAALSQKRRRLDSVDSEDAASNQKDSRPAEDDGTTEKANAGTEATSETNAAPSPAHSGPRSRSTSSASSASVSSSSSSSSSLLSSAESDIEHAPPTSSSAATMAASEQRLSFLRHVSAKRRALRPALLHARLLELLASTPSSTQGDTAYDLADELTEEEKEKVQRQARIRQYHAALEELELTLQSPEYRESKELNYLAGMLRVLCISAE